MGSDREPTMRPCGRKARTLSTTTSCYPYPVEVGEFRKNDYEILRDILMNHGNADTEAPLCMGRVVYMAENARPQA